MGLANTAPPRAGDTCEGTHRRSMLRKLRSAKWPECGGPGLLTWRNLPWEERELPQHALRKGRAVECKYLGRFDVRRVAKSPLLPSPGREWQITSLGAIRRR